MPSRARVWTIRVLIIGGIMLLCQLAGSGIPAFALSLAWGPNGLFLLVYSKGALHLPRFLERVHSVEPAIYRALGVGLAKRLVETPLWPLILGFEVPSPPASRCELLNRTEFGARGAEVCHAATFAFAVAITVYCFAVGKSELAVWLLAFNVALNAYPVMLQRTHRRRIQAIRAHATRRDVVST
jgi:hypothetical protein